jgi:hypothetical protein
VRLTLSVADSDSSDDMDHSSKDSKRSKTDKKNKSEGTVMSLHVVGGSHYLFRLRWRRENGQEFFRYQLISARPN